MRGKGGWYSFGASCTFSGLCDFVMRDPSSSAGLRRGRMEGRELRRLLMMGMFLLFSGVVHASDMVVDRIRVPVLEDFDGFEGTCEFLPDGFAVSKDGSNLLTEADSGDFKTSHAGGTSEGACRPWNLGNGDLALGYQPTSDEFTPGFFVVSVSNATGRAVKRISISYEVVCFNNENRSSSLDFEYSLDGLRFIRVRELRYVSPEAEDPDVSWETSMRSIGLELSDSLANGACIWLRWYGDDMGGGGSRDEYGINNLSVIFLEGKGTVVVVE